VVYSMIASEDVVDAGTVDQDDDPVAAHLGYHN
jgi:hypothetical protein